MNRRKFIRIGTTGCLLTMTEPWLGYAANKPQSDSDKDRFLIERQSAKKQFFSYRSFEPELKTTTQFTQKGINTRCFFAANTVNSFGGAYCNYPLIWKGIAKYDFSAYDSQANDLLEANRDARFICLIDLNTPYWLTRKFGFDSFAAISHAASDPDWIRITKQWMTDFINYSEKKYGAQIDAYILSGGGTSEWYEYDRGLSSRVKDIAWREWCKASGFHFGESVPDEASLSIAAFENTIYSPSQEMDKIQYWRFHNEIIATALLDFAKTARQNIPSTKEIGVFFGYYLVSDVGKLTSFGHLDYERVMASPDIDFMMSPGNYHDRQIGGGSGAQLVTGSLQRYGKRYLHEIDDSTHVTSDPTVSSPSGPTWKTQAEDNAGIKREAAFAIINHSSLWWFDMWGGRYTSESLQTIQRLKEIYDQYANDRSLSAAEALLIADPQSAFYFNRNASQASALASPFRDKLNKTGAPFDIYSFNDIPFISLSRYKVVFLPATVLITPERAEILTNYLCKDGRTLVWIYAPGICDGKSLDASRVRHWTGSEYKTKGPATVDFGGWKSVYAYDFSTMTSAVLKQIMIEAGVHQYMDNGDPVYCNSRLLVIHSAAGGSHMVHLPRSCRKVVDVFSEKAVAENTKDFTHEFQTPDTMIFGLAW